MDTPNRRGSGYGFYCSFGLDRHHCDHRYHPYRRSERGFFPYGFKKVRPPEFDGKLKRLEYEKVWNLGMKMLFELYDYIEKMKAKIAILNLKGKTYIWWGYVKHFKGIRTKELSWHELKRLFRNNYFSER